MSNVKIEDGNFAEDQIRYHALGNIKGCRNLTYAVCEAQFDEIWWRTRARVESGREGAPLLQLDCGRHIVFVTVDDAVPADEVKLVEGSAP